MIKSNNVLASLAVMFFINIGSAQEKVLNYSFVRELIYVPSEDKFAPESETFTESKSSVSFWEEKQRIILIKNMDTSDPSYIIYYYVEKEILGPNRIKYRGIDYHNKKYVEVLISEDGFSVLENCGPLGPCQRMTVYLNDY